MNIHPPDMLLALQVWWAFFWRSFLISFGIGLAFSLIMFLIGKLLGLPVGVTFLITIITSVFLGLFVCCAVFYNMIEQGFGRLQLSVAEKPDMTLQKPSGTLALSVWWAFAWRSTLLNIAMMIPIFLLLVIFGTLLGIPLPILNAIQNITSICTIVAASTLVMSRMLETGFGRMRLIVTDRMDA